MKQKKHILITMICLLLPFLIKAQQEVNPFANLKPGDWFEMKASFDLGADTVNQTNQYQIKYILKSGAFSGNQLYDVIIERIRIKSSMFFPSLLGYDSYYPPYLQNGNLAINKPTYQLEVDGKGKILELAPKGIFSKADLSEIAPKKRTGGLSVEQDPLVIATLKPYFETITTNIKGGNYKMFYEKTKQQLKRSFIILHAASFPLPKNTVIKGKITNSGEGKQHTIHMDQGEVKISKDGTFSISFSLTEAKPVLMIYGYFPNISTLSPFINPGDTLILNADAKNFEGTAKFEGKNAADAELGQALAKIFVDQSSSNYYNIPKITLPADFLIFQQKGKAVFDQIITSYKSKISANAMAYYRMQFMYLQAETKLTFLALAKYLSSPAAEIAFQDFPKDFFLSIDTLPLLMNDFENTPWYESYIGAFLMYQNNKLGMTNGGQFGYQAEYAMALASLKGFPLYFALSRSLQNELQSTNWKIAQRMKPYYEDVTGNCGDTSLTNPLKDKWVIMNSWAPGKPNPVKGLNLTNGTKFTLDQFKGKTLSLTINYNAPEGLKPLIERIKKQDPAKVHFVIAQLIGPSFPSSTIAAIFKKLPNVTYIEVEEKTGSPEGINMKLFQTKTFIFDKDLNVVDDNINESNELGAEISFEEAIKLSLAPKEMSKAEQAALIKIIGWSSGSILFAFGIAFWIYRVRIAALKKREQAKRQIKELEIKAIRSQMNPHFMFNALNSIQYLINHKQDKEANIYLEKFAVLMRMVLNNSEHTMVFLSDELKAITLYCELEQLRFDFSFEINIDNHVQTGLIEIPGMMIQPLVENAIIHGLAHKETKGILNIEIAMEGIYLKIVVKDNGPGLKKGADANTSGFGLKLVKQRLNLLNTNGHSGALNISNYLNSTNNGVLATLTIPID